MELFKKTLTSEELPPNTKELFVCWSKNMGIRQYEGKFITVNTDVIEWWMKPTSLDEVMRDSYDEEGKKWFDWA